MPGPELHLRARIAVHDEVRFTHRRKTMRGIVVRTNPRRAVVCSENHDYLVPYELLIPVDPAADDRVRRVDDVEQLARSLMDRHELRDWRFRFDHAARRAGCCNYHDRTISISFELALRASDVAIRDTILHEIAHALVGKKHNHDSVWKAKALEIGSSGERTHALEFSTPKWRVRCENDCWSHTAHRRNHRLICSNCGGKLVYSAYV